MSQRAEINAKTFYRMLLAFAFLAVIFIGDTHGQATEFTYQGRLSDAGNPADGMYAMQFINKGASTNLDDGRILLTGAVRESLCALEERRRVSRFVRAHSESIIPAALGGKK